MEGCVSKVLIYVLVFVVCPNVDFGIDNIRVFIFKRWAPGVAFSGRHRDTQQRYNMFYLLWQFTEAEPPMLGE